MASLGRVIYPCYGCGAALRPTIPFVKRASVMQLLRVKRTALWQGLTDYKVRRS
jgi:hypothetical protein